MSMRQRLEVLAFVILLAITLLFVLHGPASHLQGIKHSGALVVAIRNNATGYYEGPEGLAGPEYDLARAFAERLGVSLRVVPANGLDATLKLVRDHEVAFAAGLLLDDVQHSQVKLGPVYQEVTQQVVYRAGRPAPKSLERLLGRSIEVSKDGAQARRLATLREQAPALAWEERGQIDNEELLRLVAEGVVDVTVANSNEVTLNRRFYPELRVAFNLTDAQPLAWIFPADRDESLYQSAVEFFAEIKADGTLHQILERYYGHARRLDYVGTRTFMRHIEERLPRYRSAFETAAAAQGVDWRLLAAIGYQESNWNPRAKSPTGVRGLMMLTQRTAGQLGVQNRLDPEQSIMGGAEYLQAIRNRLPARIPEPDRTWMALAAYNVGFGHLEDARKITQRQDGDPDKWVDVMKRLPLLSQRKYYTQTRHGYARGHEPVQYVQNIRSYFDVLVWYTDRERGRGMPETSPPYDILPPAL